MARSVFNISTQNIRINKDFECILYPHTRTRDMLHHNTLKKYTDISFQHSSEYAIKILKVLIPGFNIALSPFTMNKQFYVNNNLITFKKMSFSSHRIMCNWDKWHTLYNILMGSRQYIIHHYI